MPTGAAVLAIEAAAAFGAQGPRRGVWRAGGYPSRPLLAGPPLLPTNAEMTLLSEVDEIEYLVADNPTDEDIEYAQKAVIIHQGQEWPAGCVSTATRLGRAP
jgi:hypothetical protein